MSEEYRREIRALAVKIETAYGATAAFPVTEPLMRAHDGLRELDLRRREVANA